MSRFIVFDVETPNRYNNRMSAIGICVVESGRITDFGGECFRILSRKCLTEGVLSLLEGEI